jgi:cobalt/nickel transport system permease protein
VFNMGILAAFVGYAVYAGLRRALSRVPRGNLIGAAVAAWISVEMAAVAASLQLAASGISSLGVALPAMAGVHALIGIGEALISAGALAFIRQARPDLLDSSAHVPAKGAGWVAAGLVIALAIVLASPLASSHPDGLERVAADHGFVDKARTAAYELLPDYTIPGVNNREVATVAAGVVGVLVVTGLSYGAARWIGRADLPSSSGHETAQGSERRA